MNRDDVIRMAREAGFEIEQPSDGHNVSGDNACLERFAALVAAAEREACAQLVDHILCEGGGTYGDAIRERGEDRFEIKEDRIHRDAGGTRAATAIRARGQDE